MVMGLEAAQSFLQKHIDLRACLMFADADGAMQIYYTPHFRSLVAGK